MAGPSAMPENQSAGSVPSTGIAGISCLRKKWIKKGRIISLIMLHRPCYLDLLSLIHDAVAVQPDIRV
jgi:hypothetical protein